MADKMTWLTSAKAGQLMNDKFKDKHSKSGIATSKGQSLESFTIYYTPGTIETEKKKAAAAFIKVAENLQKSIKNFKEKGLKEQAGILEAHLMMTEDPAMSDVIDEQIEISKSAPKAVLDAYEFQAQMLESMEDEYFRECAVEMREVGKRIAKFLLLQEGNF